MQRNINKPFRYELWLTLFIFIHLVGWTIIPALIRFNLPLDAIEGTLWGHQLEWGYDKNPFLNGWLTAFAIYLDNYSGWMVYLFSQLSVVICFWCVWQLGRKILSPLYALIAVMLLEGIQYYNFHAIDFNDNTLELGLWALTIYFYYEALTNTKNRLLYWVATGFFAGLGMMAKYYTAALLTAMVLFLFCHANNRKQLTTYYPYLGLMTFFIVILPHTIWLFFHDFITVNYVFARTQSAPSWFNHLFFPYKFALEQLQVFLPALILSLILFIGKRPILAVQRIKITSFNQAFLLFIGLGPFILTILLGIFFGIKLRAGWGMPLLSLWSIILLALMQPHVTKTKFYIFITTLFFLLIALLSAYSISLIKSDTPSSANFPGRELAQVITQTWQNTYHTKLDYVGGSRWIGGNISFYSKDHPAVFVEWEKNRSPWIDLQEIEKKGAVFVWDISDNETLPPEVKARFPKLKNPVIYHFAWKRNLKKLPFIKIGVAFLPPEKYY